MAVDPNIILGAQSPQLQNPLNMATQAMALKNYSEQSQLNDVKLQQAKQDFNDQQVMRSAMRNNVVQNPDGSQTVDRAGVLSDLNEYNPMLAAKANMNFQAMDLNKLQNHLSIAKTLMFSIHDQASLDQARSQAQSLGLPTDQLPQYYDEGLIKKAQYATLSADDQLKQRQQQFQNQVATQNAQSEALKAKAQAYEAGLPVNGSGAGATVPASLQANPAPNKAAPNLVSQNGPGGASGPSLQPYQNPYGPNFQPSPKMMTAGMNTYLERTDSSRLPPQVTQSEKDIQSADKINEAINQAPKGDPNQLNTYQTHMITSEMVKLLTGGVPSDAELEKMNPDTIVQKYAGAIQSMTGKSVPANAKEFIEQFRDYANGIAKQSMQRSQDYYNGVANNLRPQLGEGQYQSLIGQNAHKYDDSITRKILRLQELRAKAPGGQN